MPSNKPADAPTATGDPIADAAIKTPESAAMADGADETASGEYIVAPGRTVVTGDGAFGPGKKVKLDDKDAERFRNLGYLLADDGSVFVQTDGPAVNVEDGVQITQARA